MPSVFIIVMDKPIFSIKEEGSDDVFNFSGRISFYYRDGDSVSCLGIDSSALSRIVKEYSKKMFLKAVADGHSIWTNSD